MHIADYEEAPLTKVDVDSCFDQLVAFARNMPSQDLVHADVGFDSHDIRLKLSNPTFSHELNWGVALQAAAGLANHIQNSGLYHGKLVRIQIQGTERYCGGFILGRLDTLLLNTNITLSATLPGTTLTLR